MILIGRDRLIAFLAPFLLAATGWPISVWMLYICSNTISFQAIRLYIIAVIDTMSRQLLSSAHATPPPFHYQGNFILLLLMPIRRNIIIRAEPWPGGVIISDTIPRLRPASVVTTARVQASVRRGSPQAHIAIYICFSSAD